MVPNDTVHLRAGCKERDVSKNRHAGPVKCNGWFASSGSDLVPILSTFAFRSIVRVVLSTAGSLRVD